MQAFARPGKRRGLRVKRMNFTHLVDRREIPHLSGITLGCLFLLLGQPTTIVH